jgi:hypothetical protein
MLGDCNALHAPKNTNRPKADFEEKSWSQKGLVFLKQQKVFKINVWASSFSSS